MSAPMRGLVLALIGGLALAECTSSDLNLRSDAVPASSGPVPTPRVAPRVLAAPKTDQSAPTWRHLPEPVSVQQFNQDKENCTKQGNSSPGAGSPEMKFYITFTRCMRSAGYEPTPNQQ
jgi:hypothetical protein